MLTFLLNANLCSICNCPFTLCVLPPCLEADEALLFGLSMVILRTFSGLLDQQLELKAEVTLNTGSATPVLKEKRNVLNYILFASME